MHGHHELDFGSSLIYATIALALTGLAISFILKDVDESAWKWVLLIILGGMGALIVIWFLFVLLKMLTRGRHAAEHGAAHASGVVY